MNARCSVTVAALLSSAGFAFAHDGAASYSALEVRGREVRLTMTVDAAEFFDADANRDGAISDDEIEETIAPIFEAARRRLRVTAGEAPRDSVLERYELIAGHTLMLRILYTFAGPVKRVEVHSALHEELRADHQHVIRCQWADVETTSVLDRAHAQVVFQRADPPLAAGTAVFGVGGLLGYSWLRRRAFQRR